MRKIRRSIFFGKKAKYSGFGLKGCSHGMYARGGYNFWVYGIKGIAAIEIKESWGIYNY